MHDLTRVPWRLDLLAPLIGVLLGVLLDLWLPLISVLLGLLLDLWLPLIGVLLAMLLKMDNSKHKSPRMAFHPCDGGDGHRLFRQR